MYYSRHLEPVVARISKRKPVLVLTGARQVGNSTMLKEVYQDINYVTLNRPLVRESTKGTRRYFSILINHRSSLMKYKRRLNSLTISKTLSTKIKRRGSSISPDHKA